MPVSNTLRALRRRKRLTLAALAEWVGTSEKTAWRWENALAVPSVAEARLLSELLGVPIDDIAAMFVPEQASTSEPAI